MQRLTRVKVIYRFVMLEPTEDQPSQGRWKVGMRRRWDVASRDPASFMSKHRVRGVCRHHAATALTPPVWQTGCAIVVRSNQEESAKQARAIGR